MSENVLVFSPHFDDESVGCGGAIALHARAGAQVTVVFMTRGNSGSMLPGQEMDAESSERVRKAEAAAACERLGVAEIVHLDLDDGYLTWDAAVAKEMVRLLRHYQPRVVYAPHPDDDHTDHQITAQLLAHAVTRAAWAVFPTLGPQPHAVRELRYYEVWTPLRRPNFYLDITPVVASKRAAIELYISQAAFVSYTEAILGLNRYRGAMGMGAGVEYAEAFWREQP